MPIMKPRAPEYPRPVSPICADEIPVCENTIIHYDVDNDGEEEEGQRVAKRRRIEAHATNYLRGQPLFILSAGLRGPFDSGWRNPWTKEREVGDMKTTTGGHESVPRSADRAARSSPQPRKTHIRMSFSEAGVPRAKQSKDGLISSIDPVLKHADKKKTIEIFGVEQELPPKGHRVEDWLRTNEAYETSEDVQFASSPPSPSKRRAKKTEILRPNTGAPAIKTVCANDSNLQKAEAAPISPSGQPTRSFSSPVNPRPPPRTEGTRHFHSSPAKAKSPRVPVQQRDRNSLLSSIDESRAEYAILRSRQKAAQMPTVAANVGLPQPQLDITHHEVDLPKLAEPEITLPPSDTHTDVDTPNYACVQAASDQTSASLHTALEPSPSPQAEPAAINLAREAMKSSATTDLPSAQIPLVPFLQSLPFTETSVDFFIAYATTEAAPDTRSAAE